MEGKRHGFGILSDKVPTNKILYIGRWASDKRSGYGVEMLEGNCFTYRMHSIKYTVPFENLEWFYLVYQV